MAVFERVDASRILLSMEPGTHLATRYLRRVDCHLLFVDSGRLGVPDMEKARHSFWLDVPVL